METLNVGILGCARIAKKNCRAAQSSASCRIAAVASRSEEKARGFVAEVLDDDEGDACRVVAGGEDAYDRLLLDTSLDAAYVPLPTALHERYATGALVRGKHVLLEKPVATSAASYRGMLDAASREGRFLMDG